MGKVLSLVDHRAKKALIELSSLKAAGYSFDEALNTLCLNCGQRYGTHFGDNCPNGISQVRFSWSRL